MKRLFLALLAACCSLPAASAQSKPTLRPAQDSPNILLIYTDDQGSIDANCYGAGDLVTPAFDRLAKRGVRFTQMLAPAAICSASRTGLLTGQIPMRAGVPGNVSSQEGKRGLETHLRLLPELLRDAGYRTHHVGKWHLGYTPDTMPNGQGFDSSFGHMGGCIDNYSHFFYWQGPNRHDLWRDGKEVWHDGEGFGHLMLDEAKKVIDQDSAKPFFIYWAINWPHYPLQGFDKWRAHYAKKGPDSPRDKYAAFVSSMDELIGEALDHLEAAGKTKDTIVILQSDHGHSVEDRTFGGGGNSGPYRGHKGSFLEGGLRVPSIVSWPGTLPEGEVRGQFVTGCDWFPTLAAWAGARIPADRKLDGKNIDAVIRDAKAPSPHAHHFWTSDFSANRKRTPWAVRSGDWKLLHYPKDQVTPWPQGPPQYFLVNLAEDIGETTNLAKSHPGELKRLKAIAEEYQNDLLPDYKAAREQR
ncbi:MAG: sulfatase-like hydrolase/transferase [Akkermansiaceae bacterium]|nr:sulfatase-like hydrolase/transferase [Akkermansiaceae bacterium]